MPRIHELKTWPSFFSAVDSGTKTFEVRVNDRDFAVDDTLRLREWEPIQRHYAGGAFTGRQLDVLVSYVMQGGKFGIDSQYAVLGFHARSPMRTGRFGPFAGSYYDHEEARSQGVATT